MRTLQTVGDYTDNTVCRYVLNGYVFSVAFRKTTEKRWTRNNKQNHSTAITCAYGGGGAFGTVSPERAAQKCRNSPQTVKSRLLPLLSIPSTFSRPRRLRIRKLGHSFGGGGLPREDFRRKLSRTKWNYGNYLVRLYGKRMISSRRQNWKNNSLWMTL